MNFQDLLTKMKQIDEASTSECDATDTPADALFGEQGVEECGMPGMDNMPHGMMGAPKQSDSVTMNVSMNGSGAGGIRDLMSILKNIEQGEHSAPEHDHEDDILVGIGEEQDDGGFQSATTEPDPQMQGVKAVTDTGNDIHSQGGEAPKMNGGGNPLARNESLVASLAQHYQSILEGEKKTMSRAAKGVMKYGKDGMQALAKAGKEGKDLDKVRDKYNKYDEATMPTTPYAPIKPNFGDGPGGEKGDLALIASRPHKAVQDYQKALVQYIRIFGGTEDNNLLARLERGADGRFGPDTDAGMKRSQELYFINKKKWDSATSPTGQMAKADNEKRYQELQQLSRVIDPALGYAKF